MSQRQKFAIGVLAVAFAALVVDWVWLEGGAAGPASASGADGAPQGASAMSRRDGAADAELEAIERGLDRLEQAVSAAEDSRGIAQALEAVQAPVALEAVDGFARPAYWPANFVEPTVEGTTQPGAAEVFQRSYELQAVLHRQDGTGVAIVDGEPVAVGEQLDGFTLERLGENSASFRQGEAGLVVRLYLNVDPPDSRDNR